MGFYGQVVATNIKRLREEKNLTKPDLARLVGGLEQVKEIGEWELSPSKINALAITRIEDGSRRVDADDLVLFAVALGVTPATLLQPYVAKVAKVPSPIGKVMNLYFWSWLTNRRPLTPLSKMEVSYPPDDVKKARQFFLDSIPPAHHDMDKLPEVNSGQIELKDLPAIKFDDSPDE